jgi:hypothetical protein
LSLFRHNYSIGDLVVFSTNVQWDNLTAIEGEIGIVIQIYDPNQEEMFFDLNIQLCDGGTVPVWVGEVEKLENAKEL